jgi:hypothetical protein
LLAVIVAIVLAAKLSVLTAILSPAELAGAALAICTTLHRSVLSAIDSTIGQATDEV